MKIKRTDTDCDADEPLPEFPTVLPPTAPSFAERLSIDRPRTAPSTKTAFYPPPPPPPPKSLDRVHKFQQQQQQQQQTQQQEQPARRSEPTLPTAPKANVKQQVAVQASAFHSHPPCASPKIIDNSVDIEVPLAPPLPLILRPPLRKKKSFSRVSNWLFPAGVEQHDDVEEEEGENNYSPTTSSAGRRHRRDVSRDSVTNAPRALTEKDGYYQTLPPSAMFSGRRSSFDSMSDVLSASRTGSVYSTDEEMFPGRMGTTTATSTRTHWSPANTPPEAARRQLGGGEEQQFANKSGHEANKLSLDRTGTLGNSSISCSTTAPQLPVGDDDALRVKVQGPRPTSVGVAF